MKEKPVTPKFLTEELAATAVQNVLPIIKNLSGFLRGQMCHIVILVPTRDGDPHLLYEYSLGDRDQWFRKFNEIALNKAKQRWDDRNDDRTDSMPHLLFPGETPFWGAVKKYGIVVACSGFQPWFDKMISGIIADMCIALAYNAWMTSKEREDITKGPLAFLS